MTAPAKRGRPKKAAENPDCEVATKGYVKCVARRMTDLKHTHGTTNGEPTEAFGVVTMIMVFVSIIGWLVASKAEYANMVTMFASIFWMSLAIFSACAITSPVSIDKEMISDHIPDYLKQYEPPSERKKECE